MIALDVPNKARIDGIEDYSFDAIQEGKVTVYNKKINEGFVIDDYPHAYAHYKNEITLPLHTKLSDDDVQYVIDCYREVLRDLQFISV